MKLFLVSLFLRNIRAKEERIFMTKIFVSSQRALISVTFMERYNISLMSLSYPRY